MAKVVALMSMSLDGYVADANDGVAEVFDWYFSGDVEVSTASMSSGMTFHVSAPSADHLRGLQAEIGAMNASVERWYAAAIENGGTDNGAPGVRPEYSGRYYAAFALDPDGNNVEAVFHTPVPAGETHR